MPCPQPPQSEASLPLAPTTPPHPPACLPACRPSSYAAALYSAERVRVQPAAELRHVQRHRHAEHVWGALRACPALSLHSLRPPCCLRHRPPHPTLPPAFPHVAPPPMLPLCTRQWASAFNQPLSFDTSNVTSMAGMFSVRSACALPSASTVGAFQHAACAAAAPTPSRLPARMSPLFLRFLFYSAVGVGVQPAAELGHL